MQRFRPVMLLILDGWGWREEVADNAVRQAQTPNFRTPDIGSRKNVRSGPVRQPRQLPLRRRACPASLERQGRYGAAAGPQIASAGKSRERLSLSC